MYSEDKAILAMNKNPKYIQIALIRNLKALQDCFIKWKVEIIVTKTEATVQQRIPRPPLLEDFHQKGVSGNESYERISGVLFNALKRINVTFKFNRWVPHELTAEGKRKRKAACLALLRDKRKEKTLDRIVTCDEKWVYYNNTSRKKEGGQYLEDEQDRLQDEP
ncbi:hypothetical protein AVEN_78935-1 [Araneus ventricosus]|uniref:Histone-lysine N-methyltransferase SETMAR n=1 Tax=Araneus ventricosus TaxID=182803 RepID=A0A4Y2RW39_ARAVE|nr:hypothetical protein AVEN_15515-1 [Araneus ventricosus]GBN80037.1 hypothetical protein AVEN_78935-1 [Araneus ventricosus]